MTAAKRIWVATPYGKDGMGGIDRLNDTIFDFFNSHPELGLQCVRLVTRGKRGLVLAQAVFAFALARFCLAAWKGDIDLLHIHLSNGGSSYRKTVLGRVARIFRVPYVVHLHGIEFREFWARTNVFLQSELDRLHVGSAQIIVLGKYWADVVLERLPDVESRITVLPNATAGVKRSGMERDGRRVRITFLGKVGARKGVPDLIRALGRLTNLPEWSATIAGDGEIAQARAQIEQHGISSRVGVSGWLDVAARAKVLGETDILVLPSRAENLPMVIIEAFAYGVAVVATPVGAVPEAIVDGHNGLLVPVGDDAALARAIERLITDPHLRQSLGDAAQATHRERYRFDRYVNHLAEIWRRASRSSSSNGSVRVQYP